MTILTGLCTYSNDRLDGRFSWGDWPTTNPYMYTGIVVWNMSAEGTYRITFEWASNTYRYTYRTIKKKKCLDR